VAPGRYARRKVEVCFARERTSCRRSEGLQSTYKTLDEQRYSHRRSRSSRKPDDRACFSVVVFLAMYFFAVAGAPADSGRHTRFHHRLLAVGAPIRRRRSSRWPSIIPCCSKSRPSVRMLKTPGRHHLRVVLPTSSVHQGVCHRPGDGHPRPRPEVRRSSRFRGKQLDLPVIAAFGAISLAELGHLNTATAAMLLPIGSGMMGGARGKPRCWAAPIGTSRLRWPGPRHDPGAGGGAPHAIGTPRTSSASASSRRRPALR